MKTLIKTKREATGKTQQDVAVAVGSSIRHYQGIESGKTIPSARLGCLIARELNTTVEELWMNGGAS